MIYGIAFKSRLASIDTHDSNCGIGVVGHEKWRRNVYFAANKYSEAGLDKGFDVFIETARALERDRRFSFIAVGPWSARDVPSGGVPRNVTFKGGMNPEALERELAKADFFLNPVRSGVLHEGSFDGFPTTTAVMAAYHGAVLVTTDPECLNDGLFKVGEEVVVLDTYDAATWARTLFELSENVGYWKSISEKGKQAMRSRFDLQGQVSQRVSFIAKRLALTRYVI